MDDQIPIIDLFAGPGGLGEGFSAYTSTNGDQPFRIALSIEKDICAHSTLQLRSFVRQFGSRLPAAYYDTLRRIDEPLDRRLEAMYDVHPEEARRASDEAWRVELGKRNHAQVYNRIAGNVRPSQPWVLIGGPPCQAYSLAGRSRNKGEKSYRPENDHRQFLYVEYLQIIAEHQPAVFVMENVKGLLSATLKHQRIFQRIIKDLRDPVVALRREGRTLRPVGRSTAGAEYEIFSLVDHGMFGDDDVDDFVVRMERYGVPQARHRLILLGVKRGIRGSVMPGLLRRQNEVHTKRVLEGLPRLRSGLSRNGDSPKAWLSTLRDSQTRRWYKAVPNRAGVDTHQELLRATKRIVAPKKDRGSEFIACDATIDYAPDWYLDGRLGGVLNHASRGHIERDLHRYFYCACFAKAEGRSPVLSDFPPDLLPEHRNVVDALNGSNFADRFRVQRADSPATTVTSHISKDGHYYIHYDPTQCRSLTVREAARLQTFPDNYFFCGPRTAQYIQVGNAVPPLLAVEIAGIVFDFLKNIGLVD